MTNPENLPSPMTQPSRRERKHRFERKFELLALEQIMALETCNDLVYSLKVLCSAFAIAAEFVATEYGDSQLAIDSLAIGARNIRRKPKQSTVSAYEHSDSSTHRR